MAARVRLERKVQWVLGLLALLVIFIIMQGVRSYVGRATEQLTHSSPLDADERLVIVDGRSMILKPGGLAPLMTSWLNTPRDRTLSFELSSRSFQPGSPGPSAMTLARISQIVAVARADPRIRFGILRSTRGLAINARQLEEARAEHLRDALVQDGVSPSRVMLGDQQQVSRGLQSSEIMVTLSK